MHLAGTPGFKIPQKIGSDLRNKYYMFIFCCFSCENFLIGKRCLRHHAKKCCRLEPSHGHIFSKPIPTLGKIHCHEWINCFECSNHCTMLLSDVPFVMAPLRWARLFVLLFKTNHSLAKFRLCRKAGLLTKDLELRLVSLL